jgi:hypothetical protein
VGTEQSRQLLEQAVLDLPQDADLSAKAGDAHLVFAHCEEARMAYICALESAPQQLARVRLSEPDATRK